MSITYMEDNKNIILTKDKGAQAVRAINLLSLLNAQTDLNDLSFKKYVGLSPSEYREKMLN